MIFNNGYYTREVDGGWYKWNFLNFEPGLLEVIVLERSLLSHIQSTTDRQPKPDF